MTQSTQALEMLAVVPPELFWFALGLLAGFVLVWWVVEGRFRGSPKRSRRKPQNIYNVNGSNTVKLKVRRK